VRFGLLHFMRSFAKRLAFARSAISDLQNASIDFTDDVIADLTLHGSIS